MISKNHISFVDPNEFIVRLSKVLAFNYAGVSLQEVLSGSIDKTQLNKILSDYTSDYFSYVNKDEAIRNILVIGAGASKQAYKDIPLANEAIERIKTDLKIENLAEYPDIYLKYKKREKEYKLLHKIEDDLDFELHLSLLSEIFDSTVIRNKIQQYYLIRYRPSLTYEIIAHLFKHRFIDVIINFNFDELLDQAIDEELGFSNYNKIISDGHVLPYEDLLVKGKIKVPLYIKPHGTASHQSTLRFTKEHYFNLPPDIKRLIEIIASGYTGKENIKRLKVNIITIGFGMQSIEFNDILETYLPDESQIFQFTLNNITYYDLSNYKRLSKFCSCISEDEIKLNAFDIERFKTEDDLINLKTKQYSYLSNLTTLDRIMIKIYKKISGTFKEPYLPKDINRHILNNLVFNENVNTLFDYNLKPTKTFLLQKIYFELILSVIKSGGIVEIRRKLVSRLGIYYELYERTGGKINLGKLCDRCCISEELGFARTLYTNNAMIKLNVNEYLKQISEKAKKNKDQLLLDLLKRFTNAIDFLDIAMQVTSEKLVAKRDEIEPKFDDRNLLIFESYNNDSILHTDLSLRFVFLECMENTNDWDYLFCISERNSPMDFVTKDQSKFSKKTIRSLVCNLHIQKNIAQNSSLDYEIKYLPYNEHNQHMAIFIKQINNKFVVNSAVYYKKNGLSTKINPIYIFGNTIENKKDYGMLLEIFYVSWLKAKNIKPIDFTEELQKEIYSYTIEHFDIYNLNQEKLEIDEFIDMLIKKILNTK